MGFARFVRIVYVNRVDIFVIASEARIVFVRHCEEAKLTKQSAGFTKETSFCERSEATIQITRI